MKINIEQKLQREVENASKTKAWNQSTFFKTQISVKAHSTDRSNEGGKFLISSSRFVTETIENTEPSKAEEDEFYNSYFQKRYSNSVVKHLRKEVRDASREQNAELEVLRGELISERE